jgi:hypothetical protein
LALRQQIVEPEENLATLENSMQGSEFKVKKMVDLEKEKESLETKVEELESNKEADTLSRQVQDMEGKLKLINQQQYVSKETIEHLQQSLFNSEQASRKLANEKEGLRNQVEKVAAECRASRGRFAQLLHDTAEKEAKWATSLFVRPRYYHGAFPVPSLRLSRFHWLHFSPHFPPSSLPLKLCHISTPPTKTTPLFAAAPSQEPFRTTLESHFLTLSHDGILVFATEVLIYTVPKKQARTFSFLRRTAASTFPPPIRPL